MITVEIAINGTVITFVSARRVKGEPGERCTYVTGEGHTLTHDYDEGAVALAKRLLDVAGLYIPPQSTSKKRKGKA